MENFQRDKISVKYIHRHEKKKFLFNLRAGEFFYGGDDEWEEKEMEA